MSNFQSWGLNWFNTIRNVHMTEPVTIITAGGSLPVNASVIEPGSTVNSSGVRVRTNQFLFIFNTEDLSTITIQRGIRFMRSGALYGVIIDNDRPQYFNDPNKNETVIQAKAC